MAAVAPPKLSVALPSEAEEEEVKQLQRQVPPCQLLLRQQYDTRAWTGFLGKDEVQLPETGFTSQDDGTVTYSPDGSRFVVVSPDAVTVYDAGSLQSLQQLRGFKDVRKADFSPLGTHVCVWQEPELGDLPNVCVWRLTDDEIFLRSRRKDLFGCQSVQWTEDETWAIQIQTNTLAVFKDNDFSKPVGRIRLPNVTSFAVAPGKRPYHVAAFVPVVKASPASCSVFSLLDLEKAVVRKTFYKAERCDLRWSPDGQAVGVLTGTDQLMEGSYYGETGLHLMLVDGSLNCTVPFGGAKGPVLDVQFSPDSKEFVAIHGFQPAQSYIFQTRTCKPVFMFGNAARNTVVWSPHGRFILIGGFGNLPGEMDFWDRNKLTKMGSCQDRDGAKTFQWTPCGRFFLTAALWPFRRVDNNLKVWTYYGELVEHREFERLFQVAIRPVAAGVYPDLPQSPRLRKLKKEGKLPSVSDAKAYVPPHLRNSQGGKAKDHVDSVQAARNVKGPRRLDQQDRALFVDSAGVQPTMDPSVLSKSQKKKLKAKAKQAEEAAAEAAMEAEKQLGQSEDQRIEKQIRKQRKKLGQIQKLEQKATGGAQLTPEEQEKLSKKPELEAEIEELTKALAALGK